MLKRQSAARSESGPGAALKVLRTQRGLTLAAVSSLSGFPVSTLSKIENDKMSLSYDKLAKLSEILEVDIAQMFSPQAVSAPSHAITGRRSVVKSGEGEKIDTGIYKHVYPASDLLNKQLIPIVAEVCARNMEEFGELVRHTGEEYSYVLEGAIDLYTELYAPTRLETGDSVYFDSSMGHAYLAAAPGVCKVLTVCSRADADFSTRSAPASTEEAPSPKAAPVKITRPRLSKVSE